MAFLAKKAIPGVVVSDYKTEFSNPYYNTELDDGQTWNNGHVSSICGISNHLARNVYALASNTDVSAVPGAISANCTLVSIKNNLNQKRLPNGWTV